MYFENHIWCSQLLSKPEQALFCCIKTCPVKTKIFDAVLCIFHFTNKISQ